MPTRTLLSLCLSLGTLTLAAADADQKNILMIAGPPSHGFGSHEHYAGLKILEQAIESSSDQADVTVVKGWPDERAIADADSIVIYSDGGGRHPAISHLDQLSSQLSDGCGFVCLHYAVEMVPGRPGDWMVEWLGGHFEVHWSVNPHWTADFKALPEHPITRGVEPFGIHDEWYFHLRFNDSDNVTPILAAVAPPETMRRKDGPHSGNPHVRKSVAAGEKQTVAWAYERPDGGRSFGFTGGHFHWNWGNEDVRRLVTNAIRWTAGEEIGPHGSSLGDPVGMAELLENQDYRKPKNFDAKKTKEEFKLQSSAPADPRHASRAIAGLDVADGLQVTLAASEPNLKSLSNMDIDDRGRVWVMDVMNYGPRYHNIRAAGDRIVICEDTTGDGVMDRFKTYYQGPDIDSAMGICVLGNEVIVTATPHVYRFTDTDGDDKPDSKEVMFTGIENPKHDHSGHSFSFGPDGKLYWNFGNSGKTVKSADGETVIDSQGRPVIDNGQPFYGGMPFRCDLDGSNFEVLAHNFRNNWETAVDSFGTLWQSDNDDDGNRATRINYVMQHGNYGYRDELTGAGWREHRITMEAEIPLQHWHLNDPGVVPNLLLNGAGSPAGICVYEGRLLPERFWDQLVHCDPGPNVVQAYTLKPCGAGYTARVLPLVTGAGDKWFRPIDVCVAPDGSLFVTDWYDPGVGGHQFQDRDRGRLFRIAPPGVAYEIPAFDYATASGAVAALRNPNLAVRYKAWKSLHVMGAEAEDELLKLYADTNPRLRARALWLLGKIEGRGEHYVATALADDDADIRITAIRLADQLGMTPSIDCSSAASDPSPAVRRELALALKFDESPAMPTVWAQLAKQHDGRDRWYLEALGIGSDLRPVECFDAYLTTVDGDWDSPAGHDIAWRVRAPRAAEKIAEILRRQATSPEESKRYFRALEYHPAEVRNRVLEPLLSLEPNPKNDLLSVRAFERMEDIDLANYPQARQAIERHIERQRGKPSYIDFAVRYRPAGMIAELIKIAGSELDDTARVRATQLLLSTDAGRRRINKIVSGKLSEQGRRLADALALLGNARARNILAKCVTDPQYSFDDRKQLVAAMSRNPATSKKLLSIAQQNQLPADVHLLAGGLLSRSSDAGVRQQAKKLFPQARRKDQQPLPPIDQLASMPGDPHRGEKLFHGVATCGKCHPAAGQGKPVGPDLSEIGGKLSREAMLTAILAPSAGISHNYESYAVLTTDGQIITGLKISQTDEQVVIRTAAAVDRAIPTEQIESIKKSETSIMPENLHHTVDQQGLVDLVEYLSALKKS